MRFLLSLAWLVFAASANLLRTKSSDGLQLEKRTFHLVKRSRSKCGPKLALADSDSVSASTITSRNVGFIRFERNVTALQKRMDLPGYDMGKFYDAEIAKLTEDIVPHVEASFAADMSTAVMKTFSSLSRRQQYSTGEEGLSGCTSMYIISRKGVYATHWWENVSFSPDDEWRDPATQTDEELFQETVLDMLTNGGRYHPKLDADLIEDDYIRAYLIHPRKTWEETEGDVGYPTQWGEIRTTVGELVPTLQDASRWTDIPYDAVDDDDNMLESDRAVKGRNLFKYDPVHVYAQNQKASLAMLWVEGEITPYHQDQW